MAYLHNFTVTVLLVAFLCFFCESLTCAGALGKYTSLVTGLVISLSIVCAFLQIRDVNLEEFSFDETAYAAPQSAETAITEQFARNLEAELEQCIEKDLDLRVQVSAYVTADNDVLTVERLEIEGALFERESITRYVEKQFGITPEVK
ncbi:MAG: hypothetical protein IJD83_09775 [Clostridia bacterium]|nr:hypothetical protein [Clostridia bacterium]